MMRRGFVMKERAMVESGVAAARWAVVVNLVLALVKVATGLIGNSYALVADGIESTADIFSSLIVWGGLRLAVKPADQEHPYGHGKAEGLAAMAVAFMLLMAAIVIAIQSVREIRTPHHSPEWYTLVVLVVVIGVKEMLFRYSFGIGRKLGSAAVTTDAWHHRSDALTSAAAFIGISIALAGGPGYESADDWAALAAAGVIVWNGMRLMRSAVDEMMDVSVAANVIRDVEETAMGVAGVVSVEKCRIRKVGLHLAMDIHVRVDGNITVRQGHEVAHRVKERLVAMKHRIGDVIIHVEPN